MSDTTEKKIRDFTDLDVWNAAMELSESVYRLTGTFPRQEPYGLASQLQRASVSVPSNTAEGRMRGTRREYAQGVAVARGSLGEVQTQLVLANRIDYLTEAQISPLLTIIGNLSRQLNSLRLKLLQDEPRIQNASQ